MLYEEVLGEIKKNKKIKREGGHNAIPLGFPRFDKLFPGLVRGRYICLTANSGVGKSKLARRVLVNNAYSFAKEKGLKLKIFWFALEESRSDFMRALMANRLFNKFDVRQSADSFMSYQDELDDSVLELLERERDWFEGLMDTCLTVIDHESNPFGIYKYMRKYALDNGKVFVGKNEVEPFEKPVPREKGKEKRTQLWYRDKKDPKKEYNFFDRYVPNDPEEYVIVAIDHISLVSTEGLGTTHNAMSQMSWYMLHMFKKRFNWIPVAIHQQMAASESLEHIKAEMVEPTMNGLGDNKLVQRDYEQIIGLFAPERYRIMNYKGYDITQMRDMYRSLLVLKNRYGQQNIDTNLAFYGDVEEFYELPNIRDTSVPRGYLERLYEMVGDRTYRGKVVKK